MDIVSKEKRSKNMSAIKSKNTIPELLFRKLIYKLGFRYQLHKTGLPGKPDLYLKKYNTAIFIHGCFWHQHEGCKRNFMPKSNIDYWRKKLKNNVTRFNRVYEELKRKNYNILVIWECETKKPELITKILIKKLSEFNYPDAQLGHI